MFSLFIYFRQIQVLRAETNSRLTAQNSQLGVYYRTLFHSLHEPESERGELGAFSRENLPLLQATDVLALLDSTGQILQQSMNFPAEALADLYHTWRNAPDPAAPITYSAALQNAAREAATTDYLFVILFLIPI